MNVYIASFMLLLFNAVGVNTPAAAMATETAGNEAASEAELSKSADWDDATRALIFSEQPFVAAVNGVRDTNLIWTVLPIASTTGDKLEHEEGAP